MPKYASISSSRFQAYARHIGADYICDRIKLNIYKDNYYDLWYNWLTPIFDKKYQEYDRILLVEMDVFPSSENLDNIFYEDISSVGMVREFKNSYYTHNMEYDMDVLAQANLEGWNFHLHKKIGKSLPRDEKGRLKLYNSGVILLTRSAIKKLYGNLNKEDIREFIKEIYTLNLLMDTYFTKPNFFLHYNFVRLGIDITPLNDAWNYQRADYDLYTNKSLLSPKFLHLRTAHKHRLTEEFLEKHIANLYMDKLVIGCGKEPKSGWINSDYVSEGRTQYVEAIKKAGHTFRDINAAEPLPFNDNELSFIFSEHVLEHLPEEVGKFFLQEAYRVLKPGGVIRTVVPDRDFFLGLKDDDEYVKLYIDYCKKKELLDVKHFSGIASLVQSRSLSIKVSGHHWVPNLDMLINQHTQAGFKSYKVCEYFKSSHKELKNLEVNSRMRILESIILECTK